MRTSVTYRVLSLDEWGTYRDMRLAALADSPDAFGSTLSAEQARPAEQWRDRLVAAQGSGGDLPLVAVVDGRAAGLVWAKVDAADAAVVNVFQMWVAPEMRNQGLGRGLLAQVISWARSINAKVVHLGVTCGDTPAVRLYAAVGFRQYGSNVPLRDGSSLLAQNMKLVLGAGTA